MKNLKIIINIFKMLSSLCNKLYTPCFIVESNVLELIYDELYPHPIETGLPKDLNNIVISYLRYDYEISTENKNGTYVKLTLPTYKLEIQLREYNQRHERCYLECVEWTIIFNSNEIIIKDLFDTLKNLNMFIDISICYVKKSKYWKRNGLNYSKYLNECSCLL